MGDDLGAIVMLCSRSPTVIHAAARCRKGRQKGHMVDLVKPPDASKGKRAHVVLGRHRRACSVRPLELEALVTALDYLSAQVVLDDGRLVVCLQVLADEHLRAER